MRQERKPAERQAGVPTDLLAVRPSPASALSSTPLRGDARRFGHFKRFSCFHLHPHLCPCCVMSMALLAGTGEPPSVTLSTSMDFLSGLLLPWRFNMGESTRFLGGSVPEGDGSRVNAVITGVPRSSLQMSRVFCPTRKTWLPPGIPRSLEEEFPAW